MSADKKPFQICTPDLRRAKGLHGGGCTWPQQCIADGKCFYGVGETFAAMKNSAAPAAPPPAEARDVANQIIREWDALPADDNRDWTEQLAPIIAAALAKYAAARVAEEREALLNTPEIADFTKGVTLEALHQRQRWGEAHDRSKSAENWYWLVGYLAGKALRAAIEGDKEKARHHTISAAAALSQWHAAIAADRIGCGLGDDADLKPAAIREGTP